jgi:hypothetical protein
METVRGLSLWLGAALFGSLGCTIIWCVALGGDWSEIDLRMLLGLSIMTLFFTVPGSGLLGLAFGWTGQRGISVPLRRALLIPFGMIVGGALTLCFTPFQTALVGLAYGGATAIGWGLLHAAFYGRG